jgi:hypothetical protein
MTIETRVTRLEKQASTGSLAARILGARAPSYWHTTTAELETQQQTNGSKFLARLIRARRLVGIR